jgi:hypothetical protein
MELVIVCFEVNELLIAMAMYWYKEDQVLIFSSIIFILLGCRTMCITFVDFLVP